MNSNDCRRQTATKLGYKGRMAEFYEYRTGGRQPFVIGIYAIALALVLVSARFGTGPGLWALWALLTFALAHQLLGYPVAGCRIDATHWATFIDRRRRCVALDQIVQVTLTVPVRRSCFCTLTLRDGTERRLPACCLPPPPTLVKALRRRGVPVVINRPQRRILRNRRATGATPGHHRAPHPAR